MKSEVFNIDCMEGMREKPDNYYDLAVVDPPYGIGIWDWNQDIPSKDYFNELFRVAKNQFIWGGNYYNLPSKQGWVCWDKAYIQYVRNKRLTTSGIPKDTFSEFELAWTSFDRKARFIRLTNLGNLEGFDIAAYNYKMDFTGYELDKDYFDAAEKRYQNHIAQLKIFA